MFYRKHSEQHTLSFGKLKCQWYGAWVCNYRLWKFQLSLCYRKPYGGHIRKCKSGVKECETGLILEFDDFVSIKIIDCYVLNIQTLRVAILKLGIYETILCSKQ